MFYWDCLIQSFNFVKYFQFFPKIIDALKDILVLTNTCLFCATIFCESCTFLTRYLSYIPNLFAFCITYSNFSFIL
jgi:hypothetical protein